VYPNAQYNFIPHFELNPASYVINEPTAKWAYRFDIVSTKNSTTEEALKEKRIFRGDWLKLVDQSTAPFPVFTKSSTFDVTSTDKTLRHYKGTSAIITVVPNAVNGPDTNYTIPDGYPTEPVSYTAYKNLYDYWTAVIAQAKDPNSLRIAITQLGVNARFHVQRLNTDLYNKNTDIEISASFKINPTGIENASVPDINYPSYSSLFKTTDQVLDMLDSGILKDQDITFKLLPFASKQTYVDGGTLYRYWFTTLGYWDNVLYNTLPHFQCYYDLFEGNSSYPFAEMPGGNLLLSLSTDSLLNSAGNNSLPDFKSHNFLQNGYVIDFYLRPYYDDEVNNATTVKAIKDLKNTWALSAYSVRRQVIYGYDDLTVSKMPQTITKEPTDIRDSKNMVVFNGDRLVVWRNNVVYMSEPGDFYYFKEENKKEYGERVVKVLPYKNILLVFTVQNLYAIYEMEVEDPTVVSSEGTLGTKFIYATQPVLYNLLVNEKYADVIQVFNQMVLFYSEDGQMFMIKPNTMIDSETQFSLQYFNKSVNDILLNYDQYINERLAYHNIQERITKEQVQIKALLSVNYIKIFYYVPGYMTYILIYDVITNRYTAYDTLTFTDIKDKFFIDSGELYLTEQNEKMFLTMPYKERHVTDSAVDMSFTSDFKKVAINCLLDTGNLNLNNHIRKRFRDLHVVFKNLSASKILFNLETVIDDVVAHPFYDTQLQVQEINGTSYLVTIPKTNQNDLVELVDINQVSTIASSTFLYALNNNLFEENNILLDFGDFTSSKLLTHKASILGLGKVFRLKMNYVTKGDFKIQNFGIVYKERRL
jgi:hypothetical protein